MVKKPYSITLDEENVNSAKRLFNGEKLSPLLNDLLLRWRLDKEASE